MVYVCFIQETLCSKKMVCIPLYWKIGPLIYTCSFSIKQNVENIFWFVALTYFLTDQLLVLLLRDELAWIIYKFSSSLLSVSSQQIKNCWDCLFLLPNYKLSLCDFVFIFRILFSFSQISPTHSPSLPRLVLEEYDLF